VELRRAVQHGFQQSELDEQLAITRDTLGASSSAAHKCCVKPIPSSTLWAAGLFSPNRAIRRQRRLYLARVRLADVNAALRPPGPNRR
jgi:hypothetical protein